MIVTAQFPSFTTRESGILIPVWAFYLFEFEGIEDQLDKGVTVFTV
jgi:hypothetical protein